MYKKDCDKTPLYKKAVQKCCKKAVQKSCKKAVQKCCKKAVKNYFFLNFSLTKPIANTANKAIKKHL